MVVASTGGLPEPLALLPGTLLLDAGWLTGQVRDTGAFYGSAEPRLNATLWWYSASAVLLGQAVHELVLLGRGASLLPDDIRLVPRPAGLDRVVPGPALEPGATAFGAHLDQALTPVIDALAGVGRATPQSLWAIAADSLATRLLAARANLPGHTDPRPLADAVAAGSRRLRPAPRYLDVRGRVYVHRGSCCLLYRVPMGTCLSCPRQAPAERASRLDQHARAATP
ncbi:(2Fe-2S)-binding protein [Kineosporia sp. J2-2]|uniref:(2Fe-2S)-binding protein n=1 Tax=Kineosporia corallincola TaxID=2835133 RepID=A0ABS5TQD6_9ACTN|nr:(2Fe-2S)-binding protein [Kineosporia corallincola]MBT0772376.1 (2Fe-2S)-binding protein [Kineosporia corallincola]